MALLPPKKELFFSRNHPKDRRLGELWVKGSKNPAFGLLGWPDDRGIKANGGRPGAALAPDEIRKALYKCTPGLNEKLTSVAFQDFGNLILEDTISQSHKSAAGHVEELIRKKITPATLGGGNDYAYADVLGLRNGLGTKAKIGVINIDSHLDVRDLKEGITSGTPYFQLLEEKIFQGDHFVEFGIQPHHNSPEYYNYVKSKGARIVTLSEIQNRGASKVFYQVLGNLKQDCDAIYVSLDIDSVRQADAPGSSAPYPNGLTAEDVERIAHLAGEEPKVKMFSIYEVSPPLDRDGQTAALAASALWHFLSSAAQN